MATMKNQHHVPSTPPPAVRTVPPPMTHPCAGGCGTQINDGSHCIGCADMLDPGDGDDGTGLGLPMCITLPAGTELVRFDADISALVPWYGSNRLLASNVGEALGDIDSCFISFAGSLTEVRHIRARQIVANDKHKDLIRLAKVVRDPDTGPKLQSELLSAVFHETELREAQDRLRSARMGPQGLFAAHEYKSDIARARDYFIASWMGHSSNVGTKDELSGSLAVRWTGSGGGSAKRYQSAVDALCPAWAQAFRRCEFVCQDFRAFHARIRRTVQKQRDEFERWSCQKIGKAPAVDRVGLYCDPPFPGPGDKYLHPFSERDQVDLCKDAIELWGLGIRVVMRFYDHPLIRALYKENVWEWRLIAGGRDQKNEEKPEVLLVSRPLPKE